MKNILCVLLAMVLCLGLAACGGGDAPSATPSGNPATSPEQTPEATPAPIELSAEGLLQALKGAGLPIIDEVTYTSATDPNEKLGRPGEYIAKINFNDSDFFEAGASPELTIEVFENESDMIKRRDYIQDIVDAASMNAFKYYIYDSGLFLFRIPYTVTPEVAAEYEEVFNGYTAS